MLLFLWYLKKSYFVFSDSCIAFCGCIVKHGSWGGPIVEFWGPRVETQGGLLNEIWRGPGDIGCMGLSLSANQRPGMTQSDQWEAGSELVPSRGGCQASSSPTHPRPWLSSGKVFLGIRLSLRHSTSHGHASLLWTLPLHHLHPVTWDRGVPESPYWKSSCRS